MLALDLLQQCIVKTWLLNRMVKGKQEQGYLKTSRAKFYNLYDPTDLEITDQKLVTGLLRRARLIRRLLSDNLI